MDILAYIYESIRFQLITSKLTVFSSYLKDTVSAATVTTLLGAIALTTSRTVIFGVPCRTASISTTAITMRISQS